MKILLGNFCCKHGHNFEAPLLPDFCYGEFLMWSISGNVAYLNALEDKCYGDVGLLIRKVMPQMAHQDASLLQKRIFGKVACDADEFGKNYEINGSPRCPYDELVPVSYQVIFPNRFQEVRCVTHRVWNGLTAEQRERRVLEALFQE